MRAGPAALLLALLAAPVAAQDLPEMTEAQRAAYDNLIAITADSIDGDVAQAFSACLVLEASPDELAALTAAGPGDNLDSLLAAITPRDGFAPCYAARTADGG